MTGSHLDVAPSDTTIPHRCRPRKSTVIERAGVAAPPVSLRSQRLAADHGLTPANIQPADGFGRPSPGGHEFVAMARVARSHRSGWTGAEPLAFPDPTFPSPTQAQALTTASHPRGAAGPPAHCLPTCGCTPPACRSAG